MISIKSDKEISIMKEAGMIAREALRKAGEAVCVGITTEELDSIVRKSIESRGAKPAFLGYGGFPNSACISINEEVIHGIPSKRKLQEGNLVKIDVGAYYKGYNGDCARTFLVGECTKEARNLRDVTRQSFYEGIKKARSGNRITDISHAIESYVKTYGYSIVECFVGHGIGAKLHEAPEVPNFGAPGRGARLVPGMTLAIEPMVNIGKKDVQVGADEWTVITKDRSLSAHYENTIAITEGDPIILTL